ncbi:MAG: hypothetical protein IPL33_06200 [Sphingobacteriales bacterium]|nr:hypothetical protein [Sphingobacteriales bacterium]
MTLHTARHIFLLGMMGCGKTATGKALSDLLGYALADTDALIEQYTHQTITELFAQGGEGYFRHIEAACLRCLQSLSSPMVVATGGGTPCFSTISPKSTALPIAVVSIWLCLLLAFPNASGPSDNTALCCKTYTRPPH